MTKELTPLADYSRQALQVGTPPLYVFDDSERPANKELLALSLQVRMVEALEQQTKLQAESNPLTLAEYGELYVLTQEVRRFQRTVEVEEGLAEGAKVVRLCELVEKLLSGIDGGQPNG